MSERKRDDIAEDLNPEIEEDSEAHFEELYERSAEFRAAWDANKLQRERDDRVLERRMRLS